MHLCVSVAHRPVGPNQLIHRAWENWLILNGISGIHWSIEDSLEVRIDEAVLVSKRESSFDIRSMPYCVQGRQLPPRCVSIVADEVVNVCIVREHVLAVDNI